MTREALRKRSCALGLTTGRRINIGLTRGPHVVMPTDPVDLAYLAGIVDGEGFIGTGRRHSEQCPCWMVGVANTDRRLIDWLASIGGGVATRPAAGPRKEKYDWWLRARSDVFVFLDHLEPYLRIKRDRATRALDDLTVFWSKYLGLDLDRPEVEARLDALLALEAAAVLVGGPERAAEGGS